MICEYGCNHEALHQLKNGKWCCEKTPNKCKAVREKNSKSISSLYENGKRDNKKIYQNIGEQNKLKMRWNKGKTKETDKRIENAATKLKLKYETRELIPVFLNKHHSAETKEKMSAKAGLKNNGYAKAKYYEIFNPFQDKSVTVQGTFEYKFAVYLNKNKIPWIRTRTINLKYKKSEQDFIHTYYPDFYLPDSDEYIEIKGFWWKSIDGKTDDKYKMDCVIKQNPDKKIHIYMYEELKNLGIID